MLAKVVITSTGTGSGTFCALYDNPSAASGTVLFAFPSNAAAGTIYDVQIPATTGITAAQVLNGPGFNVTFH